jgi:glycosyltransferase involved in cell wall biosynthesis
MLSILIPTYNYNIYPLVVELHNQTIQLHIEFEIIVLDDGSKKFIKENSEINSLANCVFKLNPENFGRSKTRNLLAEYAKYEWLLFLDADTFPKENSFVDLYLKSIDHNFESINGGIVYQEEKPETQQLLRWKYGIQREALSVIKRNQNPYLSFLTLNFLIHKSVFKKVFFNENIPNLRHEDTLFSYELSKHKIKIKHIENPVIHYGLDTSEEFLKKSKEAVENLKYLYENHLISVEYVKLLKLSKKIKAIGLKWFFGSFYRVFQKTFEKKLIAKNSSIYLFDFYRLCYLCSL